MFSKIEGNLGYFWQEASLILKNILCMVVTEIVSHIFFYEMEGSKRKVIFQLYFYIWALIISYSGHFSVVLFNTKINVNILTTITSATYRIHK